VVGRRALYRVGFIPVSLLEAALIAQHTTRRQQK
jgi:hypothetical protein